MTISLKKWFLGIVGIIFVALLIFIIKTNALSGASLVEAVKIIKVDKTTPYLNSRIGKPPSPTIPNNTRVLPPILSLAVGGNHACLVKKDGTVWCWGENDMGQLGNDLAMTRSNTPLQVKGANNVAFQGALQVTVGTMHSCALKSNGTVWCWGINNYYQLGNDNKANFINNIPASNIPLSVKDTNGNELKNIIALSQGDGGPSHTCAIQSINPMNTLWCWGDNGYGGLGDGTTTAGLARQVKDNNGAVFKDVTWVGTASNGSTCALKLDGTVWCWGDNTHGQLGNGLKGQGKNSLNPVQVEIQGGGFLKDIVRLTTGRIFGFAIEKNNQIWYWGSCPFWQNDNFPLACVTRATPLLDAQGKNVIMPSRTFDGGMTHACVLNNDSTISCWGNNDEAQLGNGNQTDSAFLVEVKNSDGTSFRGAYLVSAGYRRTCAIKNDGTLWCWGYNSGNGQRFSLSPFQVQF